MTDIEYEQLRERCLKGRAWIERIKSENRYWIPETIPGIELWFRLTDELTAEDTKRRGVNPQESHSQAWIDLQKREAVDEQRRAKIREQARKRAERKRQGINT